MVIGGLYFLYSYSGQIRFICRSKPTPCLHRMEITRLSNLDSTVSSDNPI
jgi:hypothetical protein